MAKEKKLRSRKTMKKGRKMRRKTMKGGNCDERRQQYGGGFSLFGSSKSEPESEPTSWDEWANAGKSEAAKETPEIVEALKPRPLMSSNKVMVVLRSV